MNWPLFVSLTATALAAAFLAREARIYLRRHRRPETGAVIGWSPVQEEAEASADQLTPTGQLEREPAAMLDDGTVIGRRGLPSWEALSTDTHHAMDLRWEIMLAEFRSNMDAIIDALGEPATVGAS